jgi:hypothetical protein
MKFGFFSSFPRSPLIFSTDLSKVHQDFIDVLKNPGAIAINVRIKFLDFHAQIILIEKAGINFHFFT